MVIHHLEAEENEKFEALKTEGESGVDVLLKTIYNVAMTDLRGTPMYMSPEQYRFSYFILVRDVFIYMVMFFNCYKIFKKH